MDYTKGKWRVEKHGVIIDEQEKQIASVSPHHKNEIDQQEANAQLIASAPELYEALKALYNSDPDMSVVLVEQVQQALTNAEGALTNNIVKGE